MSVKALHTFLELAKRTVMPQSIKNLVTESSFDEQIAFHKVHERLLEHCRNERERSSLEVSYPFVKIGGRWHVSCINMYMYLLKARPALLATNNLVMKRVYRAIQEQDQYNNNVRELYDKLSPKSFEDYKSYQSQLTILYENHLSKQLELFSQVQE